MSLNNAELGRILDELQLKGSRIQSSRQVSYHSLVLNLYSSSGSWALYIETASQQARIHSLSKDNLGKMDKLQRFAQFLRSNVDSSRIIDVIQKPSDRMFVFLLDNHDQKLRLYVRLFSGPGANIIVTDENDIILDLLLRRPKRNEVSSQKLVDGLDTWKPRDSKDYEIRPYDQSQSFNSYIESYYAQQTARDNLEELRRRVGEQRDKEIGELKASLIGAQKKKESSENFLCYKEYADILSSKIHLMKKGMTYIDTEDFNGSALSINLKPDKTPSENIQLYYQRYNKEKGSYEDSCRHVCELENNLNKRVQEYQEALDSQSIKVLRAICQASKPESSSFQSETGVVCTIGGFTVLCGRNATENLKLLKTAKGNDHWFHSRDWPGGYVFVKFRRDKTLPLDVAISAAMLSLWFSKGRSVSKGSVYWTQVKYLRRVKGDSPALVIPTHEKNLDVKIDADKVRSFLGEPKVEF